MMTIKNSKACIISDLHLGVHTNSARWHEIAIEWANWLKSELVRKNIKDIIFCGDWHHNRSEISVNTLQVSADILEIFEDFNIIAILGNHDVYYKHRIDVNSLSIFKGRKNIHVIDTLKVIDVFDRTISFCPWETDINQLPESDVVFGHFEIETFKMNSFKVCEEGLKIKDLLSKTKLAISGHFHLRHEKKYNEGTILYCGNPFQMDFGDAENTKGYYILDFDTLEYSFFENTVSPQYKKIMLSDLAKEGNITQNVIKNIAGNIVKLKIDRNISQEDLSFLISRLSQLKPESIAFEYDITAHDTSDLMGEKDLSGIDIEQAIEEFVNMLEIEDKKDILSYTLDLYKKCIA